MKKLSIAIVLIGMTAMGSTQEKKDPRVESGLRQLVSQVAKEREEILQVREEYKKAIRARNLEAVMDLYDPKVIAYGISPPLEHRNRDSYRKAWRDFLDKYEGPIEFEMKDPSISWSGGLAFTFSLAYFRGTSKSDQESDIWLRMTCVYQKANGKWKIIHEHVSIPVNIESGKPLPSTKP